MLQNNISFPANVFPANKHLPGGLHGGKNISIYRKLKEVFFHVANDLVN